MDARRIGRYEGTILSTNVGYQLAVSLLLQQHDEMKASQSRSDLHQGLCARNKKPCEDRSSWRTEYL